MWKVINKLNSHFHFSKLGNYLRKMQFSDAIENLSVASGSIGPILKRNISTCDDELKDYFRQFKSLGVTDVTVPDFPKDLEWINVTRPLSFEKELKGKLVLIDFFTYCCINCMHVLPELRRLEQEYPVSEGLVVVGVHSAKFTNEKQLQNIESAVRRYEILHPVVNDKDSKFWNMLNCNCWPSLYVISPHGNPILVLHGEGHYETLRKFIKFALEYYGEDINKDDLSSVIKAEQRVGGTLSYPGKIAVDKSGSLLAISDTNNHRLLVVNSSSGDIIHSIGMKQKPGFADGAFSDAKFNAPQGLCFADDYIFVADTENHAIRGIDLKAKKVETLVGNGKQGSDYHGGELGTVQEISSPWDVLLHNDILYIAMAGTHQIWGYVLKDQKLWGRELNKTKCYNLVGSGREQNKNNPRPLLAALAQPSGLCIDEKENIYFADSESSTVRKVNLNNGSVEGLVGGALDPCNLFAYGDLDGKGNRAKLQHPLHVAYCSDDKHVYVVDSYNHKIKKIDADKKEVSTVKIKNVKLNEPGGITSYKNLLFIADTNNHCIRVFDVSKNELSILEIQEKVDSKAGLKEKEIFLDVNPDGSVEIEIQILLPENFSLTPNAPSAWTILVNNEKMITQQGDFSLNPTWMIAVKESENPSILAKCRLFICSKTDGTCFVKEEHFRFWLKMDENASEIVCGQLTHNVKL